MPLQTIIRSSTGHRLKIPITVDIPDPVDDVERSLQEYILSLSTKMPRLVAFIFEHASVVELCKHLKNHRIGSKACLYNYVVIVYSFSNWFKISPDELVNECIDPDGYTKPKAVVRAKQRLDSYVAYLRSRDLSNNTVNNHIRSYDCLFRSNNVQLNLHFRLRKWNSYECRAITREELQKLLEVANLREKVVITLMALGGFREGTLSKLRYFHVKADLEKGIVPIHLNVESEINKGKYQSYWTFLNHEAAQCLKAYLDARRIGTRKIPPETIVDESPLVRNMKNMHPVSSIGVQRIIHALYLRAGLIEEKKNRNVRYDLKPGSLRIFFRSQLAFLGVDREYIEFMMGHRTDRYRDMKMRGVEYLRRVYHSSGLSIGPAAQVNKLDIIKDIIREMGLNPEKILKPEVNQGDSYIF